MIFNRLDSIANCIYPTGFSIPLNGRTEEQVLLESTTLTDESTQTINPLSFLCQTGLNINRIRYCKNYFHMVDAEGHHIVPSLEIKISSVFPSLESYYCDTRLVEKNEYDIEKLKEAARRMFLPSEAKTFREIVNRTVTVTPEYLLLVRIVTRLECPFNSEDYSNKRTLSINEKKEINTLLRLAVIDEKKIKDLDSETQKKTKSMIKNAQKALQEARESYTALNDRVKDRIWAAIDKIEDCSATEDLSELTKNTEYEKALNRRKLAVQFPLMMTVGLLFFFYISFPEIAVNAD